MTALFAILSITCFSSISSLEEEPIENYSSKIDWSKGEVCLNFSVKNVNIKKNRAQSLYLTEGVSNLKTMHYFLKSLLLIRLDSSRTLEDVFVNSNQITNVKDSLGKYLDINLSPSRNLDSVNFTYTFSIFPNLSKFLVEGTGEPKMKKNLIWLPSDSYTGLLIYAQEPLKVYGEIGLQSLNPSLFLKIYDEKINLIVSKDMMSPKYLVKWGSAAYTVKFDENLYKDRIGTNPIRTVARGIFGKNYTDVIVSDETVEKIWSNPENNKILSEGRIVVIVTPEKINEKLLQ